jgi:hypothetical protein
MVVQGRVLVLLLPFVDIQVLIHNTQGIVVLQLMLVQEDTQLLERFILKDRLHITSFLH